MRGLHLDDRHVREKDGTGFSASIVDLAALYVVNNHQRLRDSGIDSPYLPKIQTAEEAAPERPARGARAASGYR